MTICTPYLTLVNLFLDAIHPISRCLTYIENLIPDVIELQNYGVSFSAVYARVGI